MSDRRPWHPLLERQLRGQSPDWIDAHAAFLRGVDDAYRQHDAERSLVEGALELGSQELYERNAELRALVDALPDTMLLCDAEGRVQSIKGRPLPARLAAAGADEGAWQQAVARAVAEAVTTDRVTTVHVRPDVDSAFEVRVARTSDGTAVALARDVSEAHVAAARLELSEARYRRLFEANPVPMVVCDSVDHSIVRANDAALALYGTSRDALLGRCASDLVHTSERARLEAEFTRGSDGTAAAWRHVRMDGHPIDVMVTRFHVDLEDSPGTLAVIEDISERRIAEQLRVDKEAAEAASRAKSAFLAHMTHELRTPLTAILGYTELVLEEAAAKGIADDVRDLDHVVAAGRHLLTLIAEILDMSRIESGRLLVTREPVDLDGLADEIEAAVRPLVARRRNALAVDRPAPVGEALADATKIRQIALNLLANAARFTTDGTITFGWRRLEDADGAWLECRVSDTGVGMSADTLRRLFEPFAQGGTTRESGEGTGLGLAISRHFAEGMGGRIDVTSTLAQGSTFVCRVALHPVPHAMHTESPAIVEV